MLTTQAETLHNALTDNGVSLKSLDVSSYMKTIRLSKSLSTFLTTRSTDIQDLIKEYNKEFVSKTKSKPYQEALKKSEEERTADEKKLLSEKAPVQVFPNGVITGPTDFIEKVEAINARQLKLKKDELNFVSDNKVFKAVVENATANHQLTLFEFLFKE